MWKNFKKAAKTIGGAFVSWGKTLLKTGNFNKAGKAFVDKVENSNILKEERKTASALERLAQAKLNQGLKQVSQNTKQVQKLGNKIAGKLEAIAQQIPSGIQKKTSKTKKKVTARLKSAVKGVGKRVRPKTRKVNFANRVKKGETTSIERSNS